MNITLLHILFIYLATINLIAFFTYGIDKAKSRKHNRRRISEKTLLLLALFGGSAGALLGMKMFRHKTKKLSFQAMLAVILAAQIIGIAYIYSEFIS